ncbi:AMP-binding protein [Nocardioides nitrophenolicus]|uniref:AMP-binding protein n=1 Tax=Nocardioides nitrophenolicus TaxID=60489 RepID=UPI00195E4312|nr:AMP-binding protein [Nocardioides nitrophenolicus]MBM7519897.1 cyclohexanecarboxylate-CoA ligase [Nocardioides nitrophenolicus]
MLTATRPHQNAAQVPGRSLGDVVRAAALAAPSRIAVVDGGTRLTWSALVDRATTVAGALTELGVRRGDAVVLQLPNWWETVVVTWGVWLAGGVVVPVVPIYRARELGFIVDQVDPAAIVAAGEHRGHRHADELRALMRETGRPTPVVSVRATDSDPLRLETLRSAPVQPERLAPDDVALVLYTSGTTSAPKGVLHTHRTLLAESASMTRACGLTAEDRVFMPSPLSHVTGLSYAIVLPADLRASAVLLDRWSADDAVAVVERESCTFAVSATPFLRGLAEVYAARGTPASLRIFVCGGADIPPELVRRARAVMGTAVVRTYGSTELPTVAMADPFGDVDAAADGEGAAIGDNQMTVRSDEDGTEELLVRGPELFVGYVDSRLNADAFTADGWFRTGDTATISADGVLRIAGRIKDIINRGGEKYSAAEVEWALLEHPHVAEVAVVRYPDEALGERACAFVVPTPGERPTLATLRDHLVASGYAVQKAPERLELVDRLPRTPSGKIQKFRLEEGLRLRPVRDEGESPT